ncbi:MAG: hypothetical protein R8P61_17885 [Bacteroidia bacterium]|nr:hypothetical protein [Bacteroidia bacterium]
MKSQTKTAILLGWAFGGLLVIIGILNIFLVHPVPGLIYLLLSILFLPSATAYLQDKFSFTMPSAAKIILGILIMWFTLGVSDLFELLEAATLR